MRPLTISLLFLASITTAAAQQPNYPDKYERLACAPESVCKSFDEKSLRSAAARYLGLTLDADWLGKNGARMRELIEVQCAKIANCYAQPDVTTPAFCNDIIVPEMRANCTKEWAKGSKDAEQCRVYVEIFATGLDQYTRKQFQEAHACALEKTPPVKKSVAPKVWIEPAKIPYGYKGELYVFAVDPETNLPIPGRIDISHQILWSRPNPEGTLATFYAFKWPTKFVREPNADGHTNVVAPTVTVSFDSYPEVKFPLPVETPKMTLAMTPAKLKRGRNTVTITAKDVATGQPVEARVMLGERVLGETNKPFALELKKGEKRPEIWVTSLFDLYSDAVVLPAEK
ncbi:MAG TPA: hypothetical protein VF698_11010 [Thermoanaerobaculia bacterium]|jgi:hypothetical protein